MNRAYANAKIGVIELCRSLNREYGTDYLLLRPTNLHGRGDNFDLTMGHRLAPSRVPLRGGRRRAITFCLQNAHAADVLDGLLNVGCGEDLTIRDTADIVQRVAGHECPVTWDDSRPDGTPRKLMDVSRITSLGWAPEVGLEDGIRRTYDWYVANRADR